jgi:hypothetical protein
LSNVQQQGTCTGSSRENALAVTEVAISPLEYRKRGLVAVVLGQSKNEAFLMLLYFDFL